MASLLLEQKTLSHHAFLFIKCSQCSFLLDCAVSLLVNAIGKCHKNVNLTGTHTKEYVQKYMFGELYILMSEQFHAPAIFDFPTKAESNRGE